MCRLVLVLFVSFYFCSLLNLSTNTPSRNIDDQQVVKCPHVKPYSSLLLEEQEIVKKVTDAKDLGCENAVGGACSNRENGRVCIHPHGVVKQSDGMEGRLGAHLCSALL